MALKSKAAPAATANKGGKAAATTKGGKAPAPKASEAKAAAKPTKPVELLEAGSFATFTGYKALATMPKDEIIFKEGDVIYIAEVEDTEEGAVYNCCAAAEAAAWIEGDEENVNGGQVTPSECRALTGTALERAMDTYMPVKQIGKMADLLAENDGDAIATARALNDAIAENYFYMGGALAAVLQSGAYLKENGGDFEGETAWNDFCQETFAFKGSKGRVLARVYQTFSKIEGFDTAMLDGVGWSKAAIAERFIPTDDVDKVEEILTIAASTSQRELANELTAKFSESNKSVSGRPVSRGPSIVRRTLKFVLEENAAETVSLALTHGMKQTGITDEAQMLEVICSQWAEANLEASKPKAAVVAKAKAAAKVRAEQEAAEQAKAAAAAEKAAAKKPAAAPAKPAAGKAPAKPAAGGTKKR